MGRRGRLSESGPRARPSTYPAPPVKGPVRTCVGCRERDQRSALLRLVLDPVHDDAVAGPPRIVIDVRACLPGRGAWVHPEPRCLELAERRRAVPRALRVDGPLDLGEVRAHIDQ
ncbi:YlxR family protein [Promicromonospora sp. NPDC050249]|uniref:YlxR family protein n=1 Tax=Promicromonospora sp. NPDC050249 TaxID=3154743 RepID=UPI0033EC990F